MHIDQMDAGDDQVAGLWRGESKIHSGVQTSPTQRKQTGHGSASPQATRKMAVKWQQGGVQPYPADPESRALVS